MEVICPMCNSKYNISEERIPHGKRGTATCKRCGGSIVIEPVNMEQPVDGLKTDAGAETWDNMESPYQITEREFISFIGPNSETYLLKFRKFGLPGVDNFAFTWHWPAFFVTVFWMLYRKLYLWALIAFILSFIPGIGLILMVIFGLTGNYIYYKHAKAKITDLKKQQPSADISGALGIIGGVNRWVYTVAVIFFIITILVVLATILIPILFWGS